MMVIVNAARADVNALTETRCKLTYMQPMSLSERAKFSRERRDLTQVEAARLIGCSRTTITMWETDGTDSISDHFLAPAARVYKVLPDWLGRGDGLDGYPVDTDEMEQEELIYAQSNGASGIATGSSSRLVLPQQNSGLPAGHLRIPHLQGFDLLDGPSSAILPTFLVLDRIGATPIENVAWLMNPTDTMQGLVEPRSLVLVDTSVRKVVADGIYAHRLWSAPAVKKISIRGPSLLKITGADQRKDETDVYEKNLKHLEIGGKFICAF